MKLCVGFDDALMEKYVRRGSSPLFTIYWQQGEAAYPEEQWLDFGSVILGWWLVAAKSLLEGVAEVKLSFMDSPFHLNVRRDGNLLYVSSDDLAWQCRTPIEAFVFELVAAANLVQQKFAELNVPDAEGLQEGIERLTVAKARAGAMVSTKWRR